MIIDAQGGLPDLSDPFDCCIVGSGPAGITLALQLIKTGMRVVMLEAGGREFTWESQENYEGQNLGLDYFPLESPRLRYLGGTTGHWTGRCMLLEPSDFEARDDIPLSGWPISYDELAPYQAQAADVIGAPSFGQIRHPVADSDSLDTVTQNFSSDRGFLDFKDHEPRRFGTYYAEQLAQSERLTVILNANVTDLDVNSETGTIQGATFKNYAGTAYRVQANVFTLAMGALENARFLLHLNKGHQNKFGNQGDMVGRCFMEHLYTPQGHYFSTRRLYSHSRYWEFDRLLYRTVPQLVLSPKPAYARQHGFLNGTLKLDRLQKKPLSANAQGKSEFISRLEYGEDYHFSGTCYVASEQSPNLNSRVTLTDDRDSFGMQKIGLDLQLLPVDLATVRQVALKAAEYLIQTGLGRMQMKPELWNEVPIKDFPLNYSSHHMGGARMSKTSETGVVDANCKVHGANNLYVAGSGAFTTSGFANPRSQSSSSLCALVTICTKPLVRRFSPKIKPLRNICAAAYFCLHRALRHREI